MDVEEILNEWGYPQLIKIFKGKLNKKIKIKK